MPDFATKHALTPTKSNNSFVPTKCISPKLSTSIRAETRKPIEQEQYHEFKANPMPDFSVPQTKV